MRASMEKVAAMSQKYSQEGARLIKPLTIEGNWRAQYSVSLNRGWARLHRARLPNSFGSTAPSN
jgi:hypothetical protein